MSGGDRCRSYAVRKILTAAFKRHAGFGPIGPRPPSRPIPGSDVRTYRTRYQGAMNTLGCDPTSPVARSSTAKVTSVEPLAAVPGGTRTKTR